MNTTQKLLLSLADTEIIERKGVIERILTEEQDKFDKMGPGLQESSTGAEINIGIQKLKVIIEDLDEITNLLGDII